LPFKISPGEGYITKHLSLNSSTCCVLFRRCPVQILATALPHGICIFACAQANASVAFQTGCDLFIPHLSQLLRISHSVIQHSIFWGTDDVVTGDFFRGSPRQPCALRLTQPLKNEYQEFLLGQRRPVRISDDLPPL